MQKIEKVCQKLTFYAKFGDSVPKFEKSMRKCVRSVRMCNKCCISVRKCVQSLGSITIIAKNLISIRKLQNVLQRIRAKLLRKLSSFLK